MFEEDKENSELISKGELAKVLADYTSLEAESQDTLVEVNLGNKQKKRITYVSTELKKIDQEEMVELLKEFRDCFT